MSFNLPQKLYRVNGPLAATPLTGSGSTVSKKSDNLDPESLRYHQELNASFQAFRCRKWRPLDPESIPKPSVTRCRPISARPSSSSFQNGHLVPRPPSAGRPQSVPIDFQAGHFLVPEFPHRPDTPRVTHGNYDTLSPRILAHLVTDPRPLTPLSSYGDVLEAPARRHGKRRERGKKPASRALALLTSQDIDAANYASNDSINSDADNLDDGNDEDFLSGEEGEGDDDDSDNESTSELERGLEPSVDRFRQVPDLRLRPEKLDHVYTPDNKRDMRRFDFDAEKVDIPPYEFDCPIPPPFNKISYRLHAREDTDWRYASVSLSPEDPELSAMLDRIVQLEKMQIETEEWEEKKGKQHRSYRRPVSRGGSAGGGNGNGSSAGTSGTAAKTRDKRCCNSCLQAACVGDCPNKRTPPPYCCEKCHQLLCRGNCKDTRYDQHMRQPRESANVLSLPPRPSALHKNCRTCQRKHTAKFINANNVVLGRPKSAFATFSRGQFSSKPKDLRPKSAMDIVSSISQKIERLGIDSIRPSPPSKTSRPSSRNGIIPGKTYFSNLNESLTDLTYKRRPQSRKGRRVKSAQTLRTPVENGL